MSNTMERPLNKFPSSYHPLLLQRFDRDKSGFLEFDEFCEMMVFMDGAKGGGDGGQSRRKSLSARLSINSESRISTEPSLPHLTSNQKAELQELYLQACTGGNFIVFTFTQILSKVSKNYPMDLPDSYGVSTCDVCVMWGSERGFFFKCMCVTFEGGVKGAKKGVVGKGQKIRGLRIERL